MIGFIKITRINNKVEFFAIAEIRRIYDENDVTVLVSTDGVYHNLKTPIETIDQQILFNQMDIAECFAKHLNRK